jgi:prepilin-type N-terminal cleavage/methylation domain-containing protein
MNIMKNIPYQNKYTIQQGFTMVEIIIVVIIIGLLSVAGGTVYTSSLKTARDARRKTDLENIRLALESYRNDSSAYPASLPTLEAPSKKYITLPKDPKHNINYIYESKDPVVVAGNTYYGNYSLGTFLEKIPNPVCDLSAARLTPTKCKNASGTNASCNYCVDMYGKK